MDFILQESDLFCKEKLVAQLSIFVNLKETIFVLFNGICLLSQAFGRKYGTTSFQVVVFERDGYGHWQYAVEVDIGSMQ